MSRVITDELSDIVHCERQTVLRTGRIKVVREIRYHGEDQGIRQLVEDGHCIELYEVFPAWLVLRTFVHSFA